MIFKIKKTHTEVTESDVELPRFSMMSVHNSKTYNKLTTSWDGEIIILSIRLEYNLSDEPTHWTLSVQRIRGELMDEGFSFYFGFGPHACTEEEWWDVLNHTAMTADIFSHDKPAL